MLFTFLFIIFVVSVNPILNFNGLTVDQLIQWFNYHPFLTIIILGDLFGRYSFNIITNKNKEII